MNYIEEVADKIEELYQSGKYDADFRKKLIVNSVTEVDRRARESYQPINATRIQNIEGRAYATFEVPDAEETAFFIKTTLPT